MTAEKKQCPLCGAMDDRFTVLIVVGGVGDRDLVICEDCAVDKYGYCAVCLSPVAGEFDNFAARHDGVCFECWHYED